MRQGDALTKSGNKENRPTNVNLLADDYRLFRFYSTFFLQVAILLSGIEAGAGLASVEVAVTADAGLGVFLKQLLDDLFHQPWWIDLSLVGRKGGYADPLLEILLRTYLLGQHIQVTTFFWEDTVELFDVDRIAQACKDF